MCATLQLAVPDALLVPAAGVALLAAGVGEARAGLLGPRQMQKALLRLCHLKCLTGSEALVLVGAVLA